jgi:Thioredoxin
MKKTLVVLSAVALIVAAAALVWTYVYWPIWRLDPNATRVEDVSDTISVGQSAALLGAGKTVIVEFTDYECSYCIRFSQSVLPGIKAQLSDVRYVSLNYPLTRIHPRATGAAIAAICAGEQGKLEELHARLFSVPLVQADYDTYSTAIGLDEALAALDSTGRNDSRNRPVISRSSVRVRLPAPKSTCRVLRPW